LRLSVTTANRVAWVRSEPFERPKTGRLAVFVWVKTDQPSERPPLRLAVEGRLDDRPYYPWRQIELTEDWKLFVFLVRDLPPHGLADLRVGFDLMGPGTVWIDDVQIFDRWFQDNERQELLKDKGLARFQLEHGKVVKCYRFLESFWARFLLEHVPAAPRVVQLPDAAPKRELPPSAKNPSMMDRMRRWLPNQIFRF
jgi:hypothetical protein